MEEETTRAPTRKSYSRKFNLRAVKWYNAIGKNKAQTARQWKVDWRRIREWVEKEGTIRASAQHTKKIKCGRKLPFVNLIDIDEEPEERELPNENENIAIEEDISITIKSCKDCAVCCYRILKKFKLYADAYNSIFTCYQYLLTLPITQVTCERCFSKLKFIKNSLRSTMS